jgi:chromosome partitioning protein
MLTVAVVSSKGGVGKTTLCAALAVRAAKDGDVALIDLDPMGSLSSWWKRRVKADPKNGKTLKIVEGLDGTMLHRDVRVLEGKFDYTFIDTPPAMMETMEEAVQAATVVIIPLRASAFDLAAFDPVIAACKKFNKPYGFVLNATHTKKGEAKQWNDLAKGVIDALEEDGQVLKTIEERWVYVGAVTTGKSGPEMPKSTEAKVEINGLWNAIKKLGSGK